MQKKCLLALVLAAMMLLSGCALIGVDEEIDNARVIVDVNGETITKGVFNTMVNYQIEQNQYYNDMYSTYFGYSAGYPTDAETVQQEVMDGYIENLVSVQKIKELGLDQLTEEEAAQVQKSADEEYALFLDQVAMYYLSGEELEGDALTARAEEYAAANGLGTKENYLSSATTEKEFEKLKAYAVKDVTVSQEEVTASYNEKVAADKEAYASQDAYINARNYGAVVYYTPAGMRQVKQILVKFTEEDNALITEKTTAQTEAQNALNTAQTNLDNAAEDADMDALKAALADAQTALDEAATALKDAKAAAARNILAKAEEIYALAAAEGADFDALVAQYNEDTAAPAEGYLVGADTTAYVAPFTEGAMELESIGAVSQPVLTDYGYHILQYAADVAEGPVALETVQAGIEAELLTAKQEEAYTAAVDEWIAQADVKTYPNRLN